MKWSAKAHMEPHICASQISIVIIRFCCYAKEKEKVQAAYFYLNIFCFIFLGVLRVNVVFSRLFIYLDYLSVQVEFKLCIFCCHALMQKLTLPLWTAKTGWYVTLKYHFIHVIDFFFSIGEHFYQQAGQLCAHVHPRPTKPHEHREAAKVTWKEIKPECQRQRGG